ncbi:MAG: hypothetical protein ACOYCA_01750 [Eggerthellaceae bacterium]|jgi:hypothetical protein
MALRRHKGKQEGRTEALNRHARDVLNEQGRNTPTQAAPTQAIPSANPNRRMRGGDGKTQVLHDAQTRAIPRSNGRGAQTYDNLREEVNQTAPGISAPLIPVHHAAAPNITGAPGTPDGPDSVMDAVPTQKMVNAADPQYAGGVDLSGIDTLQDEHIEPFESPFAARDGYNAGQTGRYSDSGAGSTAYMLRQERDAELYMAEQARENEESEESARQDGKRRSKKKKSSSNNRSVSIPKKKPHRIRNRILGTLGVILLIFIVLFSVDRWLIHDDAQDIQGEWTIAGSDVTFVIDGQAIHLTDSVAYDYSIDPVAKTIDYNFGTASGTGHYIFLENRQELVIVEGQDWNTFTTILYDIRTGFGSLTGQITDNDFIEQAKQGRLTVLERKSWNASVSPQGTSSELSSQDSTSSSSNSGTSSSSSTDSSNTPSGTTDTSGGSGSSGTSSGGDTGSGGSSSGSGDTGGGSSGTGGGDSSGTGGGA